MSKRAIAFVLIFSMLFVPFTAVTISAAGVYFPDVAQDAWYFDDLMFLKARGAISGYPDGSFRPDSYVTRAEFIKTVVECMGYPKSSGLSFDDTKNVWCSPYVSAALENCLLLFDEYTDGLFPDEPISRAESARILYRAAGLSRSPADSPFCDTESIYAVSLFDSCLMLGTLGQSGERYFCPDSPVRRCEICSVAARLIRFTEDAEGFITGMYEKYGLSPLSPNTSPETVPEFYSLFLYMLQNKLEVFTLTYPGLPYTSKKAEKIYSDCSEAFRLVSSNHPEYADYMSVQCKRKGNQNFFTIELKFVSDIPLELEFEYAELAKLEAEKVVGSICRDKMSSYERAVAIHDYLTDTVSYGGGDMYLSHTAYGALTDKNAVCVGYVAAFDLLCLYAKVKSFAVSNEDHAWNVVAADGEIFFFDVTWDDPIPESETSATRQYCGVGLEKILESRSWDMWDYSPEYFD